MTEERVTLHTPDGPMDAFVAHPAGAGKHPALVVMQEAFGVNEHIRDVCRRFASEGYVALAPEIFHRAGRGIEVRYDDVPAAMGQLAKLDNAGIERDLAASFDHLRQRPEVERDAVGLVGFCIGGFAAFLGACRLDPAATVAFYGGGIVRPRPNLALEPLLGEVGHIKAPILCQFGAEDQGIPQADVDAIREALDRLPVEHEVMVYPGAGHAFFCDMRPAYRPEPAQDAWRKTLDWLGRYSKRPVTARV